MFRRWMISTAAAAAACTGTLHEQTQQGGPDGGFQVSAPACDPVQATTTDGHHYPGDDCMMCHRQGGTGTPYTLGGTIYADSGGKTPAAGVVLHFIDATGSDLTVVSQTDGNFWSTAPLTPPVISFASLCPKVTPMVGAIGSGDVGCNTAGCHTVGFRVHVP
jgi:hypothetical protein